MLKKITFAISSLALCSFMFIGCDDDDKKSDDQQNDKVVCTVENQAEKCQANEECKVDEGKTEGVCQAKENKDKLANGAECAKGEDCVSGKCEKESEADDAKMVCKANDIPKKADDEECENADECATANATCEEDASKEAGKKYCKAPAPVSEKKDINGDCAAAEDCKSGVCGTDNKCARGAVATEGECEYSDQCAVDTDICKVDENDDNKMKCTDNTVVQSDVCTVDNAETICGAEKYCKIVAPATDGECEDKLAYGQSCTDASQCKGGKCEVDDGNGGLLCGETGGEAPFNIGHACAQNEDCYSGLCSGKVCVRGEKAEGDECTYWQECVAGKSCSYMTNTCASGDAGDGCEDENDCASGFTCVFDEFDMSCMRNH